MDSFRPTQDGPGHLVERENKRWLVAPYGPVGWVHNARAAGHVTLSRRGRSESYTIRELAAEDAAPVLKSYFAIARPTRAYFRADPDDPVSGFAVEADRHPVFELLRSS
jgi:hypothetical protein